MRIVILGSNGQLGQELKFLSHLYSYKFIFLNSQELDITNTSQVNKIIEENLPNILINCAAYTAVDKAESEQEKSFLVNEIAVKYLADACKKFNTHFIHISTDFVYKGYGNIPFKEEDEKGDLSVYSRSKLKGEIAIVNSTCNYTIFRVSWLYSSFGSNFVKTMQRLGRERKEINVVNDQIGNPTYARDFAQFLLSHLEKIPQFNHQIYNYSNLGEISWYEFAVEIMKLSNIDCIVNPIPTSQYPTPANRPKYSALDKSKIISDFQIEIPHWKESLKRCIQVIES